MTTDIDLSADEFRIALGALNDAVGRRQSNPRDNEHLSRAYLKLKRALICNECRDNPAVREYELGVPLCAQCSESAAAFDRTHESLPERVIRWVLEP